MVIETGCLIFTKCVLQQWKCINKNLLSIIIVNSSIFKYNEETIPFQALRESVNATPEKHAPSKTRYTRANQAPFMEKTNETKFLNTKSDLDEKHILNKEIMWLVYWEMGKRNFMVNLILTFWRKIGLFGKLLKSFLAEKSKKVSKITLIENSQIISQDKQIAKNI